MSILHGVPKHLSWNPGAEQAMYKLKVAITTAPMLRKWTPLKQGWGPLCHNILPRGPNSILWPSSSKSCQLLNATMTYATIKLDSVPLIGTQLKTDTHSHFKMSFIDCIAEYLLSIHSVSDITKPCSLLSSFDFDHSLMFMCFALYLSCPVCWSPKHLKYLSFLDNFACIMSHILSNWSGFKLGC